MDVASLLVDLYSRIPPLARDAVEGVDLAKLTQAPAPGTNPIAWLVWHMARVQDHHIAELIDEDQIWVHDDWARRFGLDADPSNIGYGHSADDVAAVRPTRALGAARVPRRRRHAELERCCRRSRRRSRSHRRHEVGSAGHARRAAC